MPRTIVITGCSSGFGKLLALQLARRGDRVYATMRGTQGKNAAVAVKLRDAATSEGIDLGVLELDVTSTASVDAAAAVVIAKSGAPDVVINIAGAMYVGFTEAISAEGLSAQLDVNVVGIHRTNRAFLPAMRQRGKGLVVTPRGEGAGPRRGVEALRAQPGVVLHLWRRGSQPGWSLSHRRPLRAVRRHADRSRRPAHATQSNRRLCGV